MISPAKSRVVQVPFPSYVEVEEEEFELVGYMKIVGEKFAEKLRAFLKEMQNDKFGRAEWFKKSNAKQK
jgi:hypothetical protein